VAPAAFVEADMTKRQLIALMALVTLSAPGCAGYYEQASVGESASSYGSGTTMSVAYFYDELSPYGRWVDAGPYGWCWVPYDVNADWRPYDDGRWVYTDLGWAWLRTSRGMGLLPLRAMVLPPRLRMDVDAGHGMGSGVGGMEIRR